MNCASANSTANSASASSAPAANGPAVGRFAPSPSGPLHFGSLTSALASFLDARSRGGKWLLRIDDLDTPRSTPGSEAAILNTLRAHQLTWDAPITRQSDNQSAYADALVQLAQQDLLFFCDCSRKSLKGMAVYPGTCRANRCTAADIEALLHEALQDRLQPDATAHSKTHSKTNSKTNSHAIRLRVPDQLVHFEDELLGMQSCNLSQDSGDYIVFRRDGLVSYQLAVVIDDSLTGVTRVVRGADLLPTTARQQHLHTQLGYRPPAWMHLPVLLNDRHSKLSKQARSQPVEDHRASQNLDAALQLLGQCPPADAIHQQPGELLSWATQHWQPGAVPASETFNNFFAW